MSGRGQPQRAGGGGEHPAQHGGHRVGLEVGHVVVEAGQHVGGVLGVQRARPQHRPDVAHRLRRGQAVPDDVTDDQADRARGKAEHVVPVAADLARTAGDVAGGELQAGQLRQPGR